MNEKNKVILGLSGGVDSTAAALLLKESGYEVTGLFIDVSGSGLAAKSGAAESAEELGIDLVTIDVSHEFEETVISEFCREYMRGRTPNPCITCNPRIKFKYLLKTADELGAGFIATGHYARVVCDESEGRFFIGKAESENKDQSYMLYRLCGEAIDRLLLPLGEFASKADVREYVSARGIRNSGLKDSQEICFIPEGVNYVEYLESRGHFGKPGHFIDVNNKIIGSHKGIMNFTAGQRKNLGMTFGKPMFVVKVDGESSSVTLGGEKDLQSDEVISKNNYFTLSDCGEMPDKYNGLSVLAKIRYAATPSEAVLYRAGDGDVRSVFKSPQRAVTPGQSVVFYKDGMVIGGGIIETASKTL